LVNLIYHSYTLRGLKKILLILKTDNTKNNFVVDEDLNHEEQQDLGALKRVKDAISKKKRYIKDKDRVKNHPDLQDAVNAHRTRRVKTKKPEKEGGKIQLELQPERKVDADLGKPIAKPEPEIDYDKLADKISQKMTRKKSKPQPPPEDDYETEDSEDDLDPKPQAKATIAPKPTPTPTSEDKFNEKIAKAPPKIVHTVARGGKFF